VSGRAAEGDGLESLDDAALEALVDGLTDAFRPEPSWASVSAPTRRIPYTRRDATLADLLGTMREEGADLVILDHGKPRGAIRGPVTELLELLATCSPFPFALVDKGLTWVVLDTSENELVTTL
jgi:hypothetical protein